MSSGPEFRWIASLYRRTAACSGAEFRRWALDHLSEQVSFCAFAWCTARVDRDDLTAVTVSNLPALALEPLLTLAATDWRAPNRPDGGHGHECRTTLATFDARDAGTRGLSAVGFVQAFVAWCPHPDTLFATMLCVLRRRERGAFSAADCERLQKLLPHLSEAESCAIERRLDLDSQLAYAGRRNRGACCLADRNGAIRAASPGFVELLGARLPDWDRRSLPAELLVDATAATATRNATLEQLGLQARLGEAQDALYKIHLRPTHPFDHLTVRERDVVKAIIGGESYKIAARRLGVTASTVANHASNIYRKLGALNREQVARLADSFLASDDEA